MTEVVHDIDIKLLRIFRTVAKYKSFSLAAEKLNTGLSNISNNMAQLEARLEMRLCERGVKGFKLTEQGQRVLKASETLQIAMQVYHDQVKSVVLDTAQEFRIGVITEGSFDPKFKLVEILADLESDLPEACFHLEFSDTEKLKNLVSNNEIHCAIGYFDHLGKNLESRHLYTEVHRCYCSTSNKNFKHILSKDFKVLQQQRIAGYDDLIDVEKQEVPLFAKYDSCSRTSEGIINLILTGNYIGLVPEHYAQHWIDREEIVVIDNDELILHVDISLLYKQNRIHEPALQSILESINRAYSGSE